MYCKQCGFHSFDHVTSCPKCGQDWEAARKALGLEWIEERKGSWIEEADTADAVSRPPVESPSPSRESSALLEGDDDFLLEEDWAISSAEELANLPLADETFIFDEEPQHKEPSVAAKEHVQPSPGESEPSAPSPMSDVSGDREDLQVPGLEEMLMASSLNQEEASQAGHRETIAVSLEDDDSLLAADVVSTASPDAGTREEAAEVGGDMEELVIPGLEEMLLASGPDGTPASESADHTHLPEETESVNRDVNGDIPRDDELDFLDLPQPASLEHDAREHPREDDAGTLKDTADDEVLEISFEETDSPATELPQKDKADAQQSDMPEIDLEELDIQFDEELVPPKSSKKT